MTVLVAHPTRQHSHRLADALQRAGLLHSYWTLLPDRPALSLLGPGLNGLLPSAVFRHSLQFLPRDKVHILLGPLLLQKWASRFQTVAYRQLGEQLCWAIFDYWVAKQLPRLMPKVVVGYEMCCTESFRVAKELGICCVLDAAAFHYRTQDRILDEDRYGANTWAGKRLRLRKQRELECADKVICVSELAKRSYVEAGVAESRILLNPVGCDVSRFSATLEIQRSGVPKFIFVGIPTYHKGFDLLTANFERLLAHYPDAELHVVGDADMVAQLSIINRTNVHGKLSHEQLSALLMQMDCLVLPSRLESFGMVVVEALTAGVPVIVSDHAGASETIIENVNGWIVPGGDEEALLNRMMICCREIEYVRTMGAACTRSAAGYDWSYYSKRAVNIFSSVLDSVA